MRRAVDQAFAAAVHLAAVDVELEQAPARDEERTLLGEERLEGAQVQDRGVGLHLPEVGVEGGVERQVRGDAVLEVAAQGHVLRTTDARRGELRHVLGHHVGGRLEPAGGLEVVEPVDVAELRDEPCLGLPEQRPAHALGVAVQIPIYDQAEGMVLLRPVA
jgi:hypothetical protein